MSSSERNTQAICKQIQENYSSCDVSPIPPFQANPSADQKNTRYQMPCSSSRSRTQAISQTSVSIAGPEMCSSLSLTVIGSPNTTREKSIPTHCSTHQHSPLRSIFASRQPLAHNERQRDNYSCKKQHPQRQTLDRRACSWLHRSAPATFGTEMCRARRHRCHAV